MRNLFVIIGMILSITSCYREVVLMEPDADKFNLLVTSDSKQFIFSSRDTSYTITDPELQLLFNDKSLELKEIRVRGKSALRYQRKSFTVFLSEPVMVENRYGSGVKELSRFKLLALAMDYTYIENRLAFGILEELGVMPLFFKFVEFRMNDETQGVYLLMEDPEQYYKEHGSEYIIRRGYNHAIDDWDYQPSTHFKPIREYEARFKEIYGSLTKYQGEDLYREISSRLDLARYFKKMGIDYLLSNGDYTDELYLYTKVEQDNIRFYPIPWDYDDIFNPNPHEVGKSWGMGTIFGKRVYNTMEDVYADVGQTLIFSIEDDLDYAIAKDPYLYDQYENELFILFQEFDRDAIERIFAETTHELSTFYNSVLVVEQSMFDAKMTSRELWEANLREKQAHILERLDMMRNQLAER